MSQRQLSPPPPRRSLLSAKLGEAATNAVTRNANLSNYDGELTPGPLAAVPMMGVMSNSTLTPSTSYNSSGSSAATAARTEGPREHPKLKVSKDYGTIPRNGSNTRLQRIYSENETTNFNSVSGRRMYDDDRHRPHRTNQFSTAQVGNSLSRISQLNSSRSFQTAGVKRDIHQVSIDRYHGMEDEYIPDFDFSTSIQQWTDSYYSQDDSSLGTSSASLASSLRPNTSIGELHALVEPVSVPKPDHHPSQADEEEFIVSKLPRNFSDLPFSMRRKIMTELSLSPHVNRDSVEKIVKKRFKRSKNVSSPALQFLSSFSEKSQKQDEPILEHILGRMIGSGAWGMIREAKSVKDGHVRAMKVIRAKSDDVKAVFRREIEMWRKLHHPHVLPLLNVKETGDSFYCLTEKACGGTLFDLVSKWGMFNVDDKSTLKQRIGLCKTLCLEIIDALMYMHKKGIVHGDVKLENCLLDCEGDRAKVLICDFGMSLQFLTPKESDDIVLHNNNFIRRRPSIPRSLSSSKLRHLRSLERIVSDRKHTHDDTRLQLGLTSSRDSSDSDILSFDPSPIRPKEAPANPNLPDSHIGSLPYAAPELLESCPPPLGPSADVWAFGVLMYTMLLGKLPFQHGYEPRLRAMITTGKYDIESLEKATLGNKAMISVVKGCLRKDLTKRLTLEEAKKLLESVKI